MNNCLNATNRYIWYGVCSYTKFVTHILAPRTFNYSREIQNVNVVKLKLYVQVMSSLPILYQDDYMVCL